ncbi:MAG: hypothetical protein Q7T33_02205 [Dehalococcoidia bacterium]|nr:hypothetical protein [Dehalococcoidia bacterium]
MSPAEGAAEDEPAQQGRAIPTDGLNEALILIWLAALFIVCAIGVYNGVDALP